MSKKTVRTWLAEMEQAELEGDVQRAETIRSYLVEAGVDVPPPQQAAPPQEAPPVEPEGFSLERMVENIPGSAMGVASGIAESIMNPIDTAKAMGQAGIGGLQHARDWVGQAPPPLNYLQYMAPFAIPMAAEGLDADYRPQASAVADMYGERYGSIDAALNTLEQDPVGAAFDVGGLVGSAAPGLAAKVNPVTRAVSAVGDRMANSIMGSATKFSTLVPSEDNAAMVRTMLDEGINPSARGVRKLDKLIKRQREIVDDLILEADNGGGTIPLDRVISRLGELREQRGGSLISGGEDMAAIDRFASQVRENAYRLGKTELSASDLQKMKVDLYDQIAWNVRRQKDEVPVLEDTRKTLARGTRQQIEELAPEAKDVNRQFGEYLELQPHLERATRRIEGRDIFGMTDMFSLASLGGGAAVGNPALGATMAAGIELFSNPKISPTVARGIYGASKAIGSPYAQPAVSLPHYGGYLYYEDERDELDEGDYLFMRRD